MITFVVPVALSRAQEPSVARPEPLLKPNAVVSLDNNYTYPQFLPDGQSIVFERSKSLNDDRAIDLWIVPLKGGSPRLLVNNGFSPSWR
jgi:Tol biopolymer transport system component